MRIIDKVYCGVRVWNENYLDKTLFCNGIEVDSCYAFSWLGRTAWCYKRNEQGNHYVDDNGEVARCKVKGKMAIR